MNNDFLSIGIPVLIALVFVNFVWAWILTTVNLSELPRNPAPSSGVDPDWKHLEQRPPIEGEALVTQEIKPPIPVA